MQRAPRRRAPGKKPRKTKRGREQDLKRGTIRIYGPNNLPPFGDTNVKPRKGASMSIRQLVGGSSFDTHTGVSAGNFMAVPVTAGVGFAFSFALADLVQSSSFTAIYDQYRIDAVSIHCIPLWNMVDGHNATNPNNNDPICFIVLDYDDSTALSSEAQALEYDNVQAMMPYAGAVIKVKPKITPATYASGAFDGYIVEDEGEWLDAASTTIQHYGVKGWLNPLTTASTTNLGWYIYAQYEVSFANVR
jgi:hypothetical protein